MTEKTLKHINFDTLCNKPFYPSPSCWEDEVLYFLMLDRFSDNNENAYKDNNNRTVTTGMTPLFTTTDKGNAATTPEKHKLWQQAGTGFAGGTLKGLQSKIGYLKRMGITAVWISPVFKQVSFRETYHGYGIQNYLDIDPHFGTREDLQQAVITAHEHGIRVILDIILNHSGDVFSYDADRYRETAEDGSTFYDPRWDNGLYSVKGFNDRQGKPGIPFEKPDPGQDNTNWPDDAVWPLEFQHPATFTRKGRINNWDHYPEYTEGDFFDLKDINLGNGPINDYNPSPALNHLCDVYKFWIAFADIDGFRVDTVKHMDSGATRYFSSVIHEFSQSLGKENFYLIGEITGGRQHAVTTMEETGLDAALGINDIPDKIEYLIKGERNPEDYFNLFRNSLLVKKESHVWFKNRVVTTFDDHDQVRKGNRKARFCYNEPGHRHNEKLVIPALALTVMSLGIPCIYYGTEQCFDGHGNNDRYLREAMFGGAFGAFESTGSHFFDENNPVYKTLSEMLVLRKNNICLRRGRQYLRPVSGNGTDFGLPRMLGGQLRSIVPWSRIFNNREMLCAINTDPDHKHAAWVTIDNRLHTGGDTLTCLYSSSREEIGKKIIIEQRNGKSVYLTVPSAGFMMYQ